MKQNRWIWAASLLILFTVAVGAGVRQTQKEAVQDTEAEVIFGSIECLASVIGTVTVTLDISGGSAGACGPQPTANAVMDAASVSAKILFVRAIFVSSGFRCLVSVRFDFVSLMTTAYRANNVPGWDRDEAGRRSQKHGCFSL